MVLPVSESVDPSVQRTEHGFAQEKHTETARKVENSFERVIICLLYGYCKDGKYIIKNKPVTQIAYNNTQNVSMESLPIVYFCQN